MIFFSFFFFECICDHLDLHSFPTRRSSDLIASAMVWISSGSTLMAASPTTSGKDVRFEQMTGAPQLIASSGGRSEEHTSELQSHSDLVCRLLLEKKKKIRI